MKTLKTLLILLALNFSYSYAQRYEYSGNEIPVKDINGNSLKMAFSGGLNQPQFSMLDINNDGIDDLFIFDRTDYVIYAFIRNEDGSFTHEKEYESVFPRFRDWILFKDYNNDGKADAWSQDVGVRIDKNVTQANDKYVKLNLVTKKQMAFDYAFSFDGNPITDSVPIYSCRFCLPAVEDIDGDGDIDFLTLPSSGIGVVHFENKCIDSNLDLNNLQFEIPDKCWGSFEESIGVTNDIFLRRGRYCGYQYYRKKHEGGSTLTMYDKDNDGDMELLLGNAGFKNIIELENGKADYNMDLDTIKSYDTSFPSNSKQISLDFFPATYLIDVDNDGDRDLIAAPNLASKSDGEFTEMNVWFYENTGTEQLPNFVFKGDELFVGDMIDHGANTSPVFIDYDSDGDLDLLLGSNGNYIETLDKADRIALYENIGTKLSPVFVEKETDFLNLSSKNWAKITLGSGDINHDGKVDLLVGNVLGDIKVFLNQGDKSFLESNLLDNINVGFLAAPVLFDYNQDGLNDLFVGEEDGNINYYENVGNQTAPKFSLKTENFGQIKTNAYNTNTNPPGFEYQGNSTLTFANADSDEDKEIIVAGLDGRINIYDLPANPNDKADSLGPQIANNVTGSDDGDRRFGGHAKIAAADIDGDGHEELFIGNSLGGLHLLNYIGGIDSNKKIIKSLDFNIYPNPSSSELIIDLATGSSLNPELVIYNALGQFIKSVNLTQKRNKIIITNLSNGVYYLTLSAKGYKTVQHKLIKIND